MTKQLKKLKAQFISISILLLYAFVFVGSNYLHHHHHSSFSKTENISADNSCELCKDAPQKTFTFNSFNVTVEQHIIQIKYSKTVEDVSAKEFFCLNNKAPPAQA